MDKVVSKAIDQLSILERGVALARAEVLHWPVWWFEQSLWSKLLPGGFVAAYWTILYLLHGIHSDHLAAGMIILVLGYAGRGSRTLLGFLAPILATGVVYDSQRYYEDYIRGPVHVWQPYIFDKTFFGIHTAQGVLTPNEWWQQHTLPALDLITGLAYLTFIGIFILCCAYFRFYVSRAGTKKCPADNVLLRSPAMIWSFFVVNVIGYTTYYWYAAAPPWYVALYGLGPARMDVGPSQAGCVRFDHLLGTHFFSDFYGRSADVFGAVPSLHVSYPLIAAYFAFRFGSLRVFTVAFYLLMCFSAVYLNHHYVLDVLLGSLYGLAVAVTMDAIYERWASAGSSASQGI